MQRNETMCFIDRPRLLVDLVSYYDQGRIKGGFLVSDLRLDEMILRQPTRVVQNSDAFAWMFNELRQEANVFGHLCQAKPFSVEHDANDLIGNLNPVFFVKSGAWSFLDIFEC